MIILIIDLLIIYLTYFKAICIILIIWIFYRRQVVGSKTGTLQPAMATTPVSCRKRKELDDSDDDDGEPSPGSTEASGDSPQASDSAVKKRKKDRHSLTTLLNGVVSMKDLQLSKAVGSN